VSERAVDGHTVELLRVLEGCIRSLVTSLRIDTVGNKHAQARFCSYVTSL
jgi:hypothetical protein